MLNKFLAAIFFLAFALTMPAQDHSGCSSDKKNESTTQKSCCTTADSTSCYSKDTDKSTSEIEMKTEKQQTGLKEEVRTETAAAKPWNSVCPVMGNEIDLEVRTVTFNDKVYGFCCDGCDDKFQREPEKYSKNLSEDGKKFLGDE